MHSLYLRLNLINDFLNLKFDINAALLFCQLTFLCYYWRTMGPMVVILCSRNNRNHGTGFLFSINYLDNKDNMHNMRNIPARRHQGSIVPSENYYPSRISPHAYSELCLALSLSTTGQGDLCKVSCLTSSLSLSSFM